MPHSLRIPARLLVSAAAFLALSALAFAQSSGVAQRDRIVGPIEESDVVTLAGNVHSLAKPEFDRGVVADETRMEQIVLLLSPDAQRQKALDELTESQQEPGSPLYHHWLTPEQYGSRFGASPADLGRIAAWLRAHGFEIDEIPAGHRSIVFSGTAAQVSDTFHTAIHRYAVDGQMHIANSQDPQIPRALAPVVSGVLSLHDFRKASAIRAIRKIGQSAAIPNAARPENTQGSTHYIFPADFATIYDLNPQYTAGENGAGASIAIVGRSNINLSDVSTFRSGSGLPANQPTVILVSTNPGLVSGDMDESTLDVEWSGGVAPGAAVKFVVGASTNSSDGVDLSAQYIVNHNTATVVSTSYGNCEAYMGSGELAFYNSLWQQGASEGISSFVSSGDSGAAGCNNGGSSSGTMAGVNGLCSSPYSTCVGGTEFNEGSGNWWAATNGAGGGSALSYIPEKVWNESALDGGTGLWASTGGASIAYTQPNWQAGVAGANHNGMRLVPDVAVTAASHDGYLICENGSWWIIAGTSAASPSYAGIMAVVVQKEGGTGQGNANPTLYGLLNAAQNPFHATSSGNNSVPGVTGFTASGTAYNLATGLGSVDANLLVNEWSGGGGGVTQGFTLHASATSETVVKGKTATFTVSVTGTGGFSGSANLTATAPSGVTVAFSPASAKAGTSATATLTVGSAAVAGNSTITITGTSGSITATTTVALTVSSAPSLSVSAAAAKVTVVKGGSATLAVTTTTAGAYAGQVVLAVTGMPTGVTATWSAATFTPSGVSSTNSTLTLKAANTTALITATLTITATGGGLKASTSAAVQVVASPSVSVSMLPTTISMKSTASQSVVVTVTPQAGAQLGAAGASFQIVGLPTGISASWGAASLTAGGNVQVTLTLPGSNSAITTSTRPTVTAHVTDSATGAAYIATEQFGLAVTRGVVFPRHPIPMV